MSLDWFYKLADWNPQFFREFKGRLKPRSFSITVVSSLVIQMLVMGYFWLALPGNDTRSNPYCTGASSYPGLTCIRNTAGDVIINWQKWWGDLFQVFSWTLPFIVLIAGVYMLIGDLGREERRGTLNFIRLSPQSSQSVLFGKVLGVPIVPFLAVGLAIPLHLVAAFGAAVPFKLVLSIYLFTAAAAACYFTGALLFAFLSGFQGWIGAVAVWFSFSIFFQIWWMRVNSYESLLPPNFFGIPLGNRLSLVLAFWVITFAVTTFWLWQAVNRRFRNPNATLLSKRQSYLLTACFNFWLLGFVIHDRRPSEQPSNDLGILAFINLIWFIILVVALMPQRQMLLDWARYRRARVSSARQFWNRSAVKDLIWGEKSPALLAIALNLVIAVAMFTPWIFTWANTGEQLQTFAAIGLGCSFLLICAAIAQFMMFLRTSKRMLWATGTIGTLIFAPPALLGLLRFYPHTVPVAWLYSAFAFAALKHVTAVQICLSILVQLCIFSLLTVRLTRQLRKAGESQTKALLTGSSLPELEEL